MPDPTPQHQEETFAGFLDAIATGTPVDALIADPFARFAASVHRVGSPPAETVTLDRAGKSRIWSELMATHGGSPASGTPKPIPGGAASTLTIPASTPTPVANPPHRSRGGPGALRFVPDLQPASTMFLVIAVMVLIGATFSWLAPNDGREFVPAVSATEHIPEVALASPEASPIASTGTCDPPPTSFAWDPEPYSLEPGSAVASRTLDALDLFFATFSACMEEQDFSALSRISSDGFMNDLRGMRAGTPPADLDDQVNALSDSWSYSLNGLQSILTYTWNDPGSEGEPRLLHVFLDTARLLEEGGVGVLVTVAPPGVSPAPDQSWNGSGAPDASGVYFAALGPGVLGLAIDQMLAICENADCIATHGPDAPAPPPPPNVGPAPVNIRIEAIDVDAPIIEQDRVTGPVWFPEGRFAVGWFIGTAPAGAPGDMVLTGFVDGFPEGDATFSNLEELPVGSPIEIAADDGGTYTYAIDSVSPMHALDDPGFPEEVAAVLNYPDTDGPSTLSIVAFGGVQDLETGPTSAMLARASLVQTDTIASPEASPATTDQWLQPITSDECDVQPRTLDEVAAIMRDPGDAPPREYLPASPVDPAVAKDAATTARAWRSCSWQGLAAQRRALESPRFISELGAVYAIDPANFASFEEWRAFNEQLSAAYLTAEPDSYYVYFEGAPTADVGDSPPELIFNAVQPRHVQRLPDGRLIVPMTHLAGGKLDEVAGRSSVLIDVVVLTQDPTQNGRWTVDEQLDVCLGGCEDYYAEIEANWWWLLSPVIPNPGRHLWDTGGTTRRRSCHAPLPVAGPASAR